MKLALIVFVGICLGQAQAPSEADVLVLCSKGLDGNDCRYAQAAVRWVIDTLHASVQDWRITLVPDEHWASTCNAFGVKPCVPAFSNLTMRATYLKRRLAVLFDDAKVDDDLARYTGLTGEGRLKWVLAHELGHLLCQTADQEVAEKVGLSLRASRQPDGCGTQKAAETEQTVNVYLNGQDASSMLLGPGKLLASRVFQKIGVRLNWRTGALPARQAAFGIRTARHAPESATGEALAASRLSSAAGVEITVYEDRMQRLLNAKPSLARVAVGYVLAHELAHAMQGKARHSESGIMKAHWDTRDFRKMSFQTLAFTAEDVDLIHQGLAARLLGNSAPAPVTDK